MINDDCEETIAEFVGAVGAACALRGASSVWNAVVDRRVCALIADAQPDFRLCQRDDGAAAGPSLRLGWNHFHSAAASEELASVRTLLLAFPGDVAGAALRLALVAVRNTLGAAGRDFTVATSGFSIAALIPAPAWVLGRLTSVELHMGPTSSGFVALLRRLSHGAAPRIEAVTVRRATCISRVAAKKRTADQLSVVALARWLDERRPTLRSVTLPEFVGSDRHLASVLGRCTRLEQLAFPGLHHDDSKPDGAGVFATFLDAARAAPGTPALRSLRAGVPPVDVLAELHAAFPALDDIQFQRVPPDFFRRQPRVPPWVRRLHPVASSFGHALRGAVGMDEIKCRVSAVMAAFNGRWWPEGEGPRESVRTLELYCDEQMPLGCRGVAAQFPALTTLSVNEPLMVHFGSDSDSEGAADPVPTCLSSRAMTLPASLKRLTVSSSDLRTSRALLGIGPHLANLRTVAIDCFDTDVAPLLQIAAQLEDLSIIPPCRGERRDEPPCGRFVADVHAVVKAARRLRRLAAHALADMAVLEGHSLLEELSVWAPTQDGIDAIAALPLPRLHSFHAHHDNQCGVPSQTPVRLHGLAASTRTLPRLHTITNTAAHRNDTVLGALWVVNTSWPWTARLNSFAGEALARVSCRA